MSVTALVFSLLLFRATPANATATQDDRVSADSLRPALCQVVYPLDQSPEDGYRYMFFGNGFFINDQGYVLTAAHLLSYFRYGGEPYILVGPPDGPRRMLEAPIAAVDWDHDVAILKPTRNPLQADKAIAYLSLSTETLAPGNDVLSASLRPPDVKNARSIVDPLEDSAQSKVIEYQFYRDKNDATEDELLLFSQEVVPGESGSPLVSAKTHAAVGIVVGQWLHPAVIPSGANGGHLTLAPGAALRIHYAISLLTQNHIAWHMVPDLSQPAATPRAAPAAVAAPQSAAARVLPVATAERAQQTPAFAPPAPLSIVATPYPPQAMFGGEVLLDALVDSTGKLVDVRVIAGDSPFVDTALAAVHTWTFTPARRDGRDVDARIGVVFNFPQSLLPTITSTQHKHPEAETDSADHAALPALTIDPDYPANTVTEGSVVLYALVDAQGQLTSTSVLRDVKTLTPATETAARQWHFVPAEHDGVKTDSAVIIVATFRRPAR